MMTTVLLGAGASVEAGLPATAALTDEVVRHEVARVAGDRLAREVELSGEASRLAAAMRADHPGAQTAYEEFRRRHPDPPIHPFLRPDPLDLVYRRLRAHAALTSKGVDAVVDLEDLVTTLDQLAERSTSGLAAFVKEWIPELLGVDHGPTGFVSGVEVGSYDRRLIDFVQFFIEQRLTGGSGENFRRARDRVVAAVRARLDSVDHAKVDYLLPLIDWSLAENAPIFTLNHDRTIEIAAHRDGQKTDDGLAEWRAGRDVVFRPGAVGVCKLHGSIDWDDLAPGTPGFLFGGVNKLTVQGPYLDLLHRFSTDLRQSERLVVIGYSFRDAHINGLVQRFLRDSSRRDGVAELAIVDPNYPLGPGGGDALPEGLRHSNSKDPFAVNLEVIREGAGSALASGVLKST